MYGIQLFCKEFYSNITIIVRFPVFFDRISSFMYGIQLFCKEFYPIGFEED